MENVPIKQAFGALKWWTGLKPLDKLLALLAAIFIASATINFYQYKEITRVQNEKTALEKENLLYAKECERRVLTSVQLQRDKDDSLRAQDEKNCEIEKQAIYGRVPIIERRNEKMKQALK